MNAYLLPGLLSGPLVIERLARKIPQPMLDVALVEGRFTPREVIAHLADWESVCLSRMQQALAQPGTSVEAFDEEVMAVTNGYATSNVEEQLAHFAARRAQTVAFLESVPADSFSRSVVHPERGVMTLEDMASMWLGHDMYHCEQLSAYL